MTSHFVKTVNLKDWWLRKADNNSPGNSLAIAGIESAGLQAARIFRSAPIVERLDIFTLKTADGVYVILKGLINKQKTCDNGFSEEVFKHFLIGFPPNWDECADKYFQQGIVSEATADAGQNPEQTTSTTPLRGKSSKENVIDVNCRKIGGTQTSRINHAVESMLEDRGTGENLISDNYPSQSKKRKRNEGAAIVRSTIMTRSSLKRIRDRTAAKINADRSPQKNADILENSTFRHIGSEKSPRSKSERKKKKSVLITPLDKNGPKQAARSSNSKTGSQSKVAASEQERKASQDKRPISRAQEIFCTPKRQRKDSASQVSVLKTSRSGRLLLPTMEFWRNQSPIYESDRGISGIMDGSSVLKVKSRKGVKYCTKTSNALLD